MTSIAAGLNKVLPAPKFSSEEAGPSRPSTSRILGAGDAERQQLVLKQYGPPAYGHRSSWRPRSQEDFGDGGAFPEIPIAQYPLDMGRKGGKTTKSKALALQVDAEGKVKYDAIAKQGHGSNRIVHASFKDLIPLRQRADVGEISLERPSEEEVQATAERTRAALEKLVTGAVAAQKPKTVKGNEKREAQYVRYTPSGQMGDTSKKSDRIIKIIEKQQDPMEPPKFKHRKIPRGPGSPPPPVMHSPPRKLTAADQEAWNIPPPVSNWKNPKGYTVPLDKRLAADGRGLQDVTINDKFAQFSEALFTADRHAREEVKQRALMQQKLAEKEKAVKEEHIRELAQKAREAANARSKPRRARSTSADSQGSARSRSRNASYSSRSGSDSEGDDAVHEREQMRRERRREDQRELRMKRMGQERKMQVLAREQGRDIGEKMALGLAKPTQSTESMFDSRLFNQSSGFSSGYNDDNPYDKPLFAAAEAANAIYRPRVQQEDDEDAADNELDRIKKNSKFEVLGRAQKGFKGAGDGEERDGPVQFEKDTADPFGVEAFVKSIGDEVGNKKHGLQMQGGPSSKRARSD
ncbi:SKIP/SNW domain-containing protein [Tricharina praecox]|uniref:SKIP/SNW domain-containing protein n=1 Tax=Tricharina praecox TaxID=43433 RepID=UPI00221FDA06|nr:SKIP/SNW domain-containing protein [Tricharina praecox]KAI5854291.1 SKIP/SNW domain-containing protein [Tricharina praecox]